MTAARFYGPITSNVDWCEDNHVYSPYIAEFWNTVSNIPPFLVAFVAAVLARRRVRSRAFARQPLDIQLAYLCPMIVYAGSFAFHATLLYAGQMADELPMILGVGYLHFVATHPSRQRVVGPPLAVWTLALITLIVSLPDNPLPLQLGYASMVGALVLRSIGLSRECRAAGDTGILAAGAGTFAAGAVLWLTDQHFCDTVKPFHFHAWWHLLTGIGTYMWIEYAAAARLHRTNMPWRDVGLFAPFGLPFGDVLPFVTRV